MVNGTPKKKHIRTSKKGKQFFAGKGKFIVNDTLYAHTGRHSIYTGVEPKNTLPIKWDSMTPNEKERYATKGIVPFRRAVKRGTAREFLDIQG